MRSVGKTLLAFALLHSVLQGQIHSVIQLYAVTSNAKEAEVQQFYKDLQALLELTPKKDAFYIIEDWKAKEEANRYLEYRQVWPWSAK